MYELSLEYRGEVLARNVNLGVLLKVMRSNEVTERKAVESLSPRYPHMWS